jgi:membrane protein DedA with SNARE-associated domain
LGGICWATGIGLLAYFLGHSAGNAIQAFGLYGVAALLLAVGVALFAHRRHRRHMASGNDARAALERDDGP